jgi:CheY-like chemotaxis protein
MEAIGRLAGGVAHDFNNLLTVIIAETDMIQTDLPRDSTHSEGLTEIRRASDSAVALTRQLLAFSRKQLIEPVVFSLNESVSETAAMLRRLIGEDVKLELSLGTDAMVRADRGQIQQVLTNLAVNARDAMPAGGVLSIETSVIVLREENLRADQEIAAGEFVLLSVGDTGTGMSDDVRVRAFEPFFTTKERGKGTGLGLATSHGIVRQAGGFIRIDSRLNVGTTFRIYLPRVHAPGTPVSPVLAVSEAPTGTETVLMVEDEAAVRRIGARILRRQGYTVLEARDADDALRILAEHSGPVHMLFTDVILPGTGGRELADRVKLVRPGIKVLFTSGYTDDVILQHKLAAQDVMLLQKPYSWVALAQKVRAALDAN